jgi:chromate transporter
MSTTSGKRHLKELTSLFLKLGCIGFGGPAVHIAMMEDEVVRKRQWMTEDHFLDLIGATNLIPGPNSTEMAMHIGHEKGGWRGLVLAGCCFIVPAVLITASFAWAYKQYAALPAVQPFLYGIKPAIIAVIVSLMITLGRKAVKNVPLAIMGGIAMALVLLGVNEMYILFGIGMAGVALRWTKQQKRAMNMLYAIPAKTTIANWKLFLMFLKIGAILYGSGYVLFGFLDAELVKTGIMTRHQLVDAIAVGQFTPGPVFSSATFIGWQIGGLWGAIAATLGIFLPSFLFVAFLNPLIPRLRRSALMSAFLDAVNVASVAIIMGICIEMGKDAITDGKTVALAVAGFIVTTVFKKLNTAFIIAGGALGGYLLSLI